MKAEDIILTDSSRGMDKVSKFLPDNFCARAARDILNLSKGTVFLLTGFWVNGKGETDGPAGTFVLYKALEKLGYTPVVITEECHAVPFTEIKVISNFPLKASEEEYDKTLDEYSPVAIISVERCGQNAVGDYTNIRGKSIKEYTGNLDILFDMCNERNILTVGVGDGGNEIGMGNIRDELRKVVKCEPCCIKADHLIVATVSNWGAYALASSMQRLSQKSIMPHFSELKDFYRRMIEAEFVDGITGKNEMSVDGFDIYDEKEIYEILKNQSLQGVDYSFDRMYNVLNKQFGGFIK